MRALEASWLQPCPAGDCQLRPGRAGWGRECTWFPLALPGPCSPLPFTPDTLAGDWRPPTDAQALPEPAVPAFPVQLFRQCPPPAPQESVSWPIWPPHDLDQEVGFPPCPRALSLFCVSSGPWVSFILCVFWIQGFLPSPQRPEALWVGTAEKQGGWLRAPPPPEAALRVQVMGAWQEGATCGGVSGLRPFPVGGRGLLLGAR